MSKVGIQFMITTKNETSYNGAQYLDGLNIMPRCNLTSAELMKSEDAFWFTGAGRVISQLTCGNKISEYVRIVTVPKKANCYKYNHDCFVSDQIYIDRRMKLSDPNTFRYLESKGGNVSIYANELLLWACVNNHLEIVKYLVTEYWADPKYGNSVALYHCIDNPDMEIMKYLIEKGADIHARYDEIFKSFAEKKRTKDIIYLLNTYDISGSEAINLLRKALEYNYPILPKYLIERYKLDLRKSRHDFFSDAVSHHDIDFIKYLVEDCKVTEWSYEALTLAAGLGHLDIVQYLFEHISFTIFDKIDAVKSATKYQNIDVIMYLLENGAPITNHRIISMAVRAGRLDAVKCFIRHGVNIHIDNDKPYKEAVRNGYVDIIEYLCQKDNRYKKVNELKMNTAQEKTIDEKPNADSQKYDKTYDANSMDILRKAILADDSITVESFINSGYSNYEIDEAYKLASKYVRYNSMYVLLKHGVSRSRVDGLDLLIMSWCNNLDAIKLLVKMGVNPHAYNDGPLKKAIRKGYLGIVMYLASIDTEIIDIKNAIRIANRNHQKEVSDYLKTLL